ncbi:MAG: hypothetical protein NT123_22380 [Proteobacteria bacterium]|nr:hypothetical protein [Pseudomonadota bacterium]
MTRTITRTVNFEQLESRGQSAATVIKLMMACNDLQLANESLSEWKKEQSMARKPRQSGAGMYFVRLQIAHLFEGLKVIAEIKNDPALLSLVRQTDAQTQQSFANLEQFLPGGAQRARMEKLMGRIRSNLTFHYEASGRLLERAIADRAARPEARLSSVTRGSTAYLWHFKAADDIVDSVVVRQIWGIPRSADVRLEADKVADELHQVFLWFVDFAGEFIWKYCGN